MPVSALVVFVPEAEPVVGALRSRFDPSASQGMSSHITVLVPFAEPGDIGDAIVAALDQAFREVPAFEFHLDRIERFPETLYLAPEPARPFVTLTRSVTRLFPSFPPYGGVHAEVIPHLTVSDGSMANAEAAEAELRRAFAASGAIACVCDSVHLIDNSSGHWRVRHVFRLPKGGA